MISISISPDRHARRRNLNTELDRQRERLLVPVEVAPLVERLNLRDAEQFVSALGAFPSAFADELGWDVADVTDARHDVVELLRGFVPDSALQAPRVRSNRRFGARNPALLPDGK